MLYSETRPGDQIEGDIFKCRPTPFKGLYNWYDFGRFFLSKYDIPHTIFPINSNISQTNFVGW